ncbi:MAG: hypothetical protein VX939_02530 [Pseudomonadota bacterium]|nr:hypothetical protein [Pseudomonadota bacterium]
MPASAIARVLLALAIALMPVSSALGSTTGLDQSAAAKARFLEGVVQFALDTGDLTTAQAYLPALKGESATFLKGKLALDLGDQASAKRHFSSVMDGAVHRGDAALALAQMAEREGLNEEATRRYQQAQQLGYGDTRQQAALALAEQARKAGNSDLAGQRLADMEPGYWSAVGYMNLAAEFSERDLNGSQALVSLRVAMAMAAADGNEDRRQGLLDQLHVRAARVALEDEDFDKAIGFLEKVSLTGYEAPQALYLHGVAWSGKQNQRSAMQSWHRAKKFPLAFPGVAEAWLGMGRGYDLAGYPGQAGEEWLAANAAYEGERVTLQTLARNIREQGAYKSLLEDAKGDQSQWFLAESRTLAQPRIAYLLRFLEQPGAQAAVNRVARLANMERTLEQRDANLAIFLDVLLEQRGSEAGVISIIQDQRALTGALQQQVQSLRARTELALDELALAFVESEDRRMAQALDRTEQQIAHLYEYLALETLAERQP